MSALQGELHIVLSPSTILVAPLVNKRAAVCYCSQALNWCLLNRTCVTRHNTCVQFWSKQQFLTQVQYAISCESMTSFDNQELTSFSAKLCRYFSLRHLNINEGAFWAYSMMLTKIWHNYFFLPFRLDLQHSMYIVWLLKTTRVFTYSKGSFAL